jgi:hypothetical protein
MKKAEKNKNKTQKQNKNKKLLKTQTHKTPTLPPLLVSIVCIVLVHAFFSFSDLWVFVDCMRSKQNWKKKERKK